MFKDLEKGILYSIFQYYGQESAVEEKTITIIDNDWIETIIKTDNVNPKKKLLKIITSTVNNVVDNSLDCNIKHVIIYGCSIAEDYTYIEYTNVCIICKIASDKTIKRIVINHNIDSKDNNRKSNEYVVINKNQEFKRSNYNKILEFDDSFERFSSNIINALLESSYFESTITIAAKINNELYEEKYNFKCSIERTDLYNNFYLILKRLQKQ